MLFAACQYHLMVFIRALHHLLLSAALVALLFAPASMSAAEAAMVPSAMAAAVTMDGMVDMPEAMPCCPKPKPVPSDCGKACPLALICTSSLIGHTADEVTVPDGVVAASTAFNSSVFTALSSLGYSPPQRPPKV